MDRHAGWAGELLRRVFDGPGNLAGSVRRAAGGEGSLDDPVAEAYVEKVRTRAYEITDRDLDRLRAAGWSEDRIFELSVAAATGAARQRLDAALAAMAAAGPRGADTEALSTEAGG